MRDNNENEQYLNTSYVSSAKSRPRKTRRVDESEHADAVSAQMNQSPHEVSSSSRQNVYLRNDSSLLSITEDGRLEHEGSTTSRNELQTASTPEPPDGSVNTILRNLGNSVSDEVEISSLNHGSNENSRSQPDSANVVRQRVRDFDLRNSRGSITPRSVASTPVGIVAERTRQFESAGSLSPLRDDDERTVRSPPDASSVGERHDK